MSPAFVRTALALMLGTTAAVAVLSINESWLTPGTHSDAVAYLSAAESLAERGELTVPVAPWSSADSVSALAHYPPGFSALVSIPIRAGVGTHAAAMWTIAVSAGVAMAFAFLLGDLVAGAAGGVLVSLFLFLTPVVTKLHLAVWSEPSYLALMLPLVYLMAKRPSWSWAHGLLAAAGVAVRYVGLAGSATAVAWALLHRRTWADRVRGALAAGAPSALLFGGWQIHVSGEGGSVRRLGWHGGLGDSLLQIPAALTEWLVPTRVGGGAVVAFALVGLGVWAVRRARAEGDLREGAPGNLARIGALYAAFYAAILVGARLLADPRIPFDARLLLPLLVLGTVVAGGAAVMVLKRSPWKAQAGVGALFLLWGLANWAEIRVGVRTVNEHGRFYTHESWISSPLITWLDARSGPYERIYSNEAEMVVYLSQRNAWHLPRRDGDLAAFGERFRAAPGAVFLAYPLHRDDVAERRLLAAIDVQPAMRSRQGAIYVPREGGATGDPAGTDPGEPAPAAGEAAGEDPGVRP